MIEAELKADVHHPEHVSELLSRWADAEVCVYRDTYYERPGEPLEATGAELRLRTISGPGTKHLLTWKEGAVDEASQSKPEYETEVAERDVVDHLLLGLGLAHDIAFEKQCQNHRFHRLGRDFLATLVQVPEVGDATFIELETLVPEPEDVPPALDAIKSVFAELGIDPVEDLNGIYYQTLVRDHRAG
jgi:adenylate cyclase class 2